MRVVHFKDLPCGLGKSTACCRPQPVPHRHHFPPPGRSRLVCSADYETTKGTWVKFFLTQDCGAVPTEPDKHGSLSAP